MGELDDEVTVGRAEEIWAFGERLPFLPTIICTHTLEPCQTHHLIQRRRLSFRRPCSRPSFRRPTSRARPNRATLAHPRRPLPAMSRRSPDALSLSWCDDARYEVSTTRIRSSSRSAGESTGQGPKHRGQEEGAKGRQAQLGSRQSFP
jgi:hypothetical protein